MAFTFTAGTFDPINGIQTYGATTDATSAAGTLTLGFVPRKIDVYDITNANLFHWNDQFPDASVFKTAAGGTTTTTYATANGFTPVKPVTGASGAQGGITLGTAIHTNSSTYKIVAYR